MLRQKKARHEIMTGYNVEIELSSFLLKILYDFSTSRVTTNHHGSDYTQDN